MGHTVIAIAFLILFVIVVGLVWESVVLRERLDGLEEAVRELNPGLNL